MDVSKNNGTPKSWVFHYKQSILGGFTPYFWKHPNLWSLADWKFSKDRGSTLLAAENDKFGIFAFSLEVYWLTWKMQKKTEEHSGKLT